MVVISVLSFMTARVRHERMRRPLMSTVQAPHWPWSNPSCSGEVEIFAKCIEQGGPRPNKQPCPDAIYVQAHLEHWRQAPLRWLVSCLRVSPASPHPRTEAVCA